MKLSALDWLALVLLVVGGLNWGLVGAFGFDLVAFLFGMDGLIAIPAFATIVYILVGVSAVYVLFAAIARK